MNEEYVLLVADDEQLERDAVVFLIEKGHYPVRCVKAKNGREAVAVARKEKPQIAFLDIQMPGLNGLDAAREIKSFLPGCQIAFLTAWGTFDFAREAIRLGAVDYIVKPSSEQQLYAVLEKCIKELKRIPADAFKKVASLFTREFFAGLKYGDLSEATVRSYFTANGINGEEGISFVLGNVREERFATLFGSCPYCFFPAEDRTTLLAFSSEQQVLTERLMEMKPTLFLKGETIGIGIAFSSIKDIPVSIRSASIAYGSALHGDETVVRFAEIALRKEGDGESFRLANGQNFKRLQNLTFSGDVAGAMQAAHEMIDAYATFYSDRTRCETEFHEILLVYCYGVRSEIPNFFREKPAKGSMMEMENFLMDFIGAACDAIKEDRGDKYARSFALVSKFLNAHYADQLVAEDVARMVQVNPNYFPKLFKEYFGVSFIEYLTDIRMKKAAVLLKGGTSVKDTASFTGFLDGNYFSRVFRQYYGTSPKQYQLEKS